MNFGKIIIKNFLAITDAEFSMADRGLVLIQGENDADTSAVSNGAGKSSLADALCWALYGTTARGESGDFIINDIAKKGCMVCVDIYDGEEKYVITRYRKHKEGKNSLKVHNATNALAIMDMTQGTDKLTQVVVDKIIGSSYEVFKSSVYAGQENMPDLPSLTDKALKIIVEEAAGITLLEEAYTESKRRLREVKDLAQILVNKEVNTESTLKDLKSNVLDLEGDISKWDTEQKEIISVSVNESKRVANEAIELKKEIGKKTKIEDIESQISVIDAKIDGVSSEFEELDRLKGKATTSKNEKDAALSEMKRIEGRVSTFNTKLDRVGDIKGSPCESCSRPITEKEIKPIKDEIEKEIATLLSEMGIAGDYVMDISDQYVFDAETRNKFKLTMTDISSENASRAKLERLRDDMKLDLNKFDSLVKKAKAGAVYVKKLKDDVNPYIKNLEKAKGRVSESEDELLNTKKLLEINLRKIKIAEESAAVFSPSGVRARILDDVTPFLNDQTAKYLGSLSDGGISATWVTLVKTARGELREKFAIEVEHEKGGKRFGLLSGGEKRKVRIATVLALQDLVARRATKPIDLFIGDEIDDALDEAGLERLMGVLEEKASERGSVFVISHNSLRDWISNVLTITRDGSKTIVSEGSL